MVCWKIESEIRPVGSNWAAPGGASLGSLDRNWMQVPFVSLTWGVNPSKLNVSF